MKIKPDRAAKLLCGSGASAKALPILVEEYKKLVDLGIPEVRAGIMLCGAGGSYKSISIKADEYKKKIRVNNNNK